MKEEKSAALAVRELIGGQGLRAYVLTFGCQQNEADSEKLLGMCEEMGYTPTETADDADLILVNTCAVREHAELRALSIIGGFKRRREQNPRLIIGVCGCMAAREDRVAALRKSYPYVSFTMRPADLARMPEFVLEVMTRHKRKFSEGDLTTSITEGIPTHRRSGYRAYVTVMYGCNNFCSYCIVPYVRGRERSRESGEVYAEVKALVEKGYRDIMLLGQNVNSYRSDCDFATLLRRLDEIEGDYILRFMSSHPKDLSDDLIAAVAECRHVEPHFHLPVQAGSDKVLTEMNRRYGAERYLSLVEKLRSAVPDIVLTSDVMVGFPGETEEDFEATLSLLRKAKFDMVYSFIYSPRPGTPAAQREDQVEEGVKGERMRRLLALQDEISLAHNERLVGRRLRVLADSPSEKEEGVMNGRTDGGKLVHFPADASLSGKFCFVKIEKAEPYALLGRLEEE